MNAQPIAERGTIDRYLERHQAQGPAALHHLRQRRRRQVDADRPAAPRLQACLFDDQLAALEADSSATAPRASGSTSPCCSTASQAEREQGITIDVAYRFFATDAAQLHRRRHARPRAIHPQHGHGRLDRRPRRDARRRPQGPADPDPAPQPSSPTCSASAIVLAVNKMDLVGYDQGAFDAIVADFRVFADQLGIAGGPPSRSRRSRATMSSAGEAMPWYGGPALVEHLEQWPRTRAGARGASPAGAVGQPAARLSRLCRPDRGGAASPATVTSSCPRGARPGSPDRRRRRRPRRRPRRQAGHADPGRRGRLRARRRHRRRRRSARGRRPVRGDPGLDGRGGTASRPRPIC